MDFQEYSGVISRLVLAIHVPAGTGEPVHHDRPTHGLVYRKNGLAVYHFQKGPDIFHAGGQMVYLPKGSDYVVEEIHGESGCDCINFTYEEDVSFPPFCLKMQRQEHIMNLYQTAENAARSGTPGQQETAFACLYELISMVKKVYYAVYLSTPQKKLVSRAVQYISSKINQEKLTIGEIAAFCGISEVYLRKLFRSQLQTSPSAYILSARLTYAARLLESDEYTITAVCSMSGFNNISYFSRAFKNTYGVSPANYRKTLHQQRSGS